VWVVFFFFLGIQAALAEELIANEGHGFSLKLPTGYEAIAIPEPRVALAARPRRGGFPTLTVTVDPGPFHGEQPHVELRGARILESYRAIGLVDAELKAVSASRRGDRPVVEAQLEYTQGGSRFLAEVTEITVPERRITITWLGPREVVEHSFGELGKVRESLRVGTSLTGESSSPERPRDFGPIYAETEMGRFPVEPWNTASNIVFLLVLVVFARRTALDRRRYPFLVPGLLVLAVGFVGGTVYHATRSHNVWLLLDFLPILILTGAASIYFWCAVVANRYLAIALCLALLLSGRLLRVYLELPKNLGITLSYLGAALAILIPAALHAQRRGREHRRFLGWATIFFALALTCRYVDKGAGLAWLPMGTHFLWHILGGMSVWALLHYIARIEEDAQRGKAHGDNPLTSAP
jgi:hypothetical protein